MKTLLYITVNSKPEELSASKIIGLEVVNRFLTKHTDFQLDILNKTLLKVY